VASRINPKPGNGITCLVGDGRCPIVDTWWQTETGGILSAIAGRRSQAGFGDQALFRLQAGTVGDKGET